MLFNLSNGLQVTDQNGTMLTSLPAVGATFCDPLLGMVYAPSYSFPNYVVSRTAACSQAAIATALATAPVASVSISVQLTGNPVVPSVLILQNWSVGYGLTNPFIYGYRAGYVWEGLMEPAGTNWTLKNKTAINAELLANGYPAIP